MHVLFRRQALADIDDVLDYTEARWGPRQRTRYEGIIAEAVEHVAENPLVGRSRPELDPDARSLFIKRPGKNASHILYYFVDSDGTVCIVRLLHASQDPVLHLVADSWAR